MIIRDNSWRPLLWYAALINLVQQKELNIGFISSSVPISSPPSTQETDSRGERGREAAGQPADAAASAGSFPEDVEPAIAAGPALPAQLLPLRPAEPAALGRRQ